MGENDKKISFKSIGIIAGKGQIAPLTNKNGLCSERIFNNEINDHLRYFKPAAAPQELPE